MAETTTTPRTLVLGCDVNCVPNLPPLLTEVIGDGFDFISVPLVHPRHRRDSTAAGVSKSRSSAFTRSDLLLPSSSWTRSVVGKLSPWLWPAIEARGSNGEFSQSRRNAEDALKQELAWASHLSLPAVLFPQLPAVGHASNTCRLINQCVQQQPYYQVWVTVPLADWTSDDQSTLAMGDPSDSPWSRWNRLRGLCEHSQALFVALELGGDLPEDLERELVRWEAEPVKVLLIPCSSFVTNKKGFPVLSKRHQSVVKRFCKFNVQMMLTGKPKHASGRKVYQQYLRHLHGQMGGMTAEEQIEAPYLDYLQAPLQPLMDNLESQTYETFERDPVKYEQYRKAVVIALVDFINSRHPGALGGGDESSARTQPPPPALEASTLPPPPPPTTTEAAAAVSAAEASPRKMEDDDEEEEEGSEYGDGGDAGGEHGGAHDELSAAIAAGLGSDDDVREEEEEGVVSIDVVLMVVGAGRGPLVRASLKACEEIAAMLLLQSPRLNPPPASSSSPAGAAGSESADSGNKGKKSKKKKARAEEGEENGAAKKATTTKQKPEFKLKPRLFAVEKNPNAVVTLRALIQNERWSNVTVVSEDMRRWQPPDPEKDLADIMVSELLGSFGDNELSPECLDGAQRFLRPVTGVSIPVDYTSYLAPLAGAKLWNEAKHSKTIETPLKALETAYVVKMHNAQPLAPSQLAFEFRHPNPDWPDHVDNSRFRTLQFRLEQGATVHGLVGYFESKLYGDVYISILPGSPNFSHGMFSWFPLYFPLRDPVYAAAGEGLSVDMWRGVSSTKVWYEWAVSTDHHTSPLHNPNGRSYWIGL